jgi:anthranilate/para-aminobenzoate synthase component I
MRSMAVSDASGFRAESCAWLSAFYNRPLMTVSYWGGYAIAAGPAGTIKVPGCGFEILEAMLESWRGRSDLVLVGFLSYDLASEIEDLGPAPPAGFDFPKFHFGLYKAGQASACAETSPGVVDKPKLVLPHRAAFEASVKRIVAAIHAGEIFQTNLCRSIEAQIEPGGEWELFRRMRAVNPARYEGFLRIDSRRAVLSMSPELFLKVEKGIVESRPIKGTRPRGGNPETDNAMVRELQTSEKDRAELAMIVDVTRNDLGRVCKTGSVEVAAHAELMSLPTVHHLFSTVKGRVREGIGPVDLLRATFPAASITGAPKIEAMHIAKREEGQERGPCMGAIGWISLDGRMELSVAIRTAFAIDGRVRYYAGCGITAGSDPQAEFEESEHKAAAFLRVLRAERF